MLTSKDLMTGDWYAFQGHPYQCTASDIASIAECEEKGAPTDISEIPLTPEILEKNGFENVADEDEKIMQIHIGIDAFWWSSKFGTCGCEGNENKDGQEYFIKRFSCGNIWNVHELQHALRLCKIDKTIEL